MSVDLSGRRMLVTVADLDVAGAQQAAEPLGAGFAGVDLADPSFGPAALSAGQDIVVNKRRHPARLARRGLP
jgi:hypothetical protein